MNWFYALDGRQHGPVDDAEFQKLRTTGAINLQTLVWREGMGNWQAFGELFPEAAGPAPSAPSAPPGLLLPAGGEAPRMAAAGLICSGCGKMFPEDEVVRLDSGFVCAACKPAAIQRLREGVTTNSAAEEIRNAHIKHEASVKSVGFLYLLGGTAVVLIGGGGMIVPLAAGGGGAPDAILALGVSGLLLLVGVVQLAAGLALRRLKPWSRIAGCVISGIGLLGFPFGTLINGYILYLLLSAKGRMVFSEEYRQIIAQTPHIKYRTSIIVWILLGILLLFLGIAFAGFLFGFSSVRGNVGP